MLVDKMKRRVKAGLKFIERLFKNRFFQIVLVVFLIDRITKIFALNRCPCVVGAILNIVTIANRGIAFGLFKGDHSNILFTIVSILIVLLLYYFAFKKLDGKTNSSKGIRLGIVFMIAGAIGNIVDRIFFGYVLDIFSFHLSLWYFPAFNIADVSITFGAVLAIVYSLFEKKKSGDKPSKKSDTKSVKKAKPKKSVKKPAKKSKK